jgi:hypothetical protein
MFPSSKVSSAATPMDRGPNYSNSADGHQSLVDCEIFSNSLLQEVSAKDVFSFLASKIPGLRAFENFWTFSGADLVSIDPKLFVQALQLEYSSFPFSVGVEVYKLVRQKIISDSANSVGQPGNLSSEVVANWTESTIPSFQQALAAAPSLPNGPQASPNFQNQPQFVPDFARLGQLFPNCGEFQNYPNQFQASQNFPNQFQASQNFPNQFQSFQNFPNQLSSFVPTLPNFNESPIVPTVFMARSIELGQLNHQRHLDGTQRRQTPRYNKNHTIKRLQLTQNIH